MLIHPTQVAALKALYRAEYNADLSDDGAWDLALRLTTLVRLLRKAQHTIPTENPNRGENYSQVVSD